MGIVLCCSRASSLVLNLVENEFGNVQERGEEGSVMVSRQPTSSSLKQSKQFTVGEWVRGISPIVRKSAFPLLWDIL